MHEPSPPSPVLAPWSPGCRLSPLLLFLALWAAAPAAGPATAQQTPPGADAPVVAPGDPSLDASRVRLGMDTVRVFVRRDGREALTALQIEERSRTRLDGRETLLQVMRVQRPGGAPVLTDTTWHELPGLRPLRHRSHGNGRTLELEYGPGEAVGTRTPDTAATRPVRIPLPEPVFEASASVLVLEALALEPGDRARLPFVVHRDESTTHYRIRARRMEEIEDGAGGSARALRVENDLPDGRRLVYWLDPGTRRLLLGRAPAGPDAEMIIRP